MAVVACGAIARHVADIAVRRGWPVDVHPLTPLLHNHPERIAEQVETLVGELADRYDAVAVGYADCGTYGALGEVCRRFGVPLLSGSHCYDVFAGADEMSRLLAEEPGTYVLTDFLAMSFRRTVVAELGLDRHPGLRDDYFGNYRRVVWLAQHPTAELRGAAEAAAATLGLPLEVVVVGDEGLERQLAGMIGSIRRAPAARC